MTPPKLSVRPGQPGIHNTTTTTTTTTTWSNDTPGKRFSVGLVTRTSDRQLGRPMTTQLWDLCVTFLVFIFRLFTSTSIGFLECLFCVYLKYGIRLLWMNSLKRSTRIKFHYICIHYKIIVIRVFARARSLVHTIYVRA